jgi:hypothetical protein
MNNRELQFWGFGGGFGIIGAITNDLTLLLIAGLAIIAFNSRFEKKAKLESEE